MLNSTNGEWKDLEETSLSSYPLSSEDREVLRAEWTLLEEEGLDLYLSEKQGEVGIMVWGEEEPRITARLR